MTFCVAAALLPAACAPPDAFDDHAAPALASLADFERLAGSGPSTRAVKFVFTRFSDEAHRELRFLDSNAFSLHDEWYWFRLLNGAAVPGAGVAPIVDLSFDSVASIYSWAKARDSGRQALPLDLRFVDDGRLYSPRFYQLALGPRPRAFALGTLVHAPARGTAPERWAFELEYTHEVTLDELAVYFAALPDRIPKEAAASLRWLVRSPDQEALAARMEREGLPFGDRVLRYRDLSVPGEREVYASGVTAGRLRVLRAGEPLVGTSATDILLLEQTPDLLPPCAGVITAVPQTPLAHVAFLARNRGIPDVYLGGVLEDPAIDQLARARAPVALRADPSGRVDLLALTEEELQSYLSLAFKPPLTVAQPALDGVAAASDLAALSIADLDGLRPILGGKSSGMLALLGAPGVVHPERPAAISIRPYVEHLAPLRPRLAELLLNPHFDGDVRARYLALEGQGGYDGAFPAAADQAFKAELLARYAPGTVFGDLAHGKGVRGAIRAAPMNAATLAEITDLLRRQYGDYDPRQGLRFRSSSNAEDIDGFNGAGLYDSTTGFLDPAAQPSADDRKKTIEAAIKKTWASYWAPEAFEERRLERIDHLSGAMGVLVHAQLDDALERSNGVFTYTIQPGELPDARVLELNAQAGALSVTNPPPGDPNLPEIDRVRLPQGGGAPQIDRLRRSTLSPEAPLLSDAQLLDLFAQASVVAEAWLARQNRGVAPARQGRALTLDFEFRHVKEGWPALRAGAPFPSRVVIKQARTLDPAVRAPVPVVEALPIPRDVRVRAAQVERRSCSGPELRVTVHEVYTDPLSRPDLGYARLPFTAQVALTVLRDLPALGLVSGATLGADHLAYGFVHSGDAPVLRLTVREVARAAAGFDSLELRPDGSGSLGRGGATVPLGAGVCATEALLASPREYLLRLLRERLGA